ncbi:hypothetical protein AB0G67_42830 [Streptomyces sp. NPDC021056]|uniref:hypothetical protein n=1 Tax=Streptomyces sp. NPDC021056 TaxID=3155012 RepID=UPI00340B89A2
MAKQAVLTPEEIDLLEPSFIGPTWQRHAFGRWVLPNETLGWQIAGWCAEHLQADERPAEAADPRGPRTLRGRFQRVCVASRVTDGYSHLSRFRFLYRAVGVIADINCPWNETGFTG